jgi:vitamin B12 transporter
MSKSIPLFAILLASVALPAQAQDILVTRVATGAEQPIEDVGQSVSVVGAEEIADVQGPDLTRVVERLPGVTLTRNGGLGGFTGLRVRGANAEQLLVLVDGIRVADVAAPGGGTDLGNIVSGGIGKIELLRGSNSVAWGSEAIGGVLALTSREIDGVEVAAEYGARESFDGQTSVGLAGVGHALTLSAGHTRSDGFSTAASGTEPDGFRQWRVNGRGRVDVLPGLRVVAAGRYADSRLDQDGFPAPDFTFADTPEYQKTRDAAARGGLEYRATGLELIGGVAWSQTKRTYFDPTFGTGPNYQTDGRAIRAEAGGRIGLPADLVVTFGGDSEWSRFSSTFDAERRARLSSGHALLGFHRGGLDLTAGARLDDHDHFGSEWTFGANGSFAIGGGWRARASYGEGFKAPTLFQLYSDFGNALLVPEHSRSFDAGIELAERNAPLHFAATVFRRDSRDLIDFVSCFGVTSQICVGRPFGTYDNIGAARAEGFELEAAAELIAGLRFRGAYSFVEAVNRRTGRDLARRPRHALSVSGDWAVGVATLGADLRVVGDSFDDANEAVPLDGYALVTVRAGMPLAANVELYGRIENLGDVRYQTVAGYGTAGRSAFVGARARF